VERLTAPGLAMAAFVASDATLFGALILSVVDFRGRVLDRTGERVPAAV
jgi:hypothetical protein